MRFGILGTGLNPDMSQHLFAVDRLASGGSERLIAEGYPLGPQALVTALAELAPSSVHAFDGLMLTVAIATCLAPLGVLAELSPWRRIAGALLVGFAYLLAANHVQGAFKEAIEALFVLTFAIGLGELAKDWTLTQGSRRLLRGLPLALLAIGSVYTYSFPGLVWIVGAALVWAAIELLRESRRTGVRDALRRARPAAATALATLAVVVAAMLPELGRMIDFASFETFNPDGAGLGNLFNRLSPLEAFGIWPSGDYRVEPGDGAVPAIVFYLGAALGVGAFAFGARRWIAGGDRAVPAAVLAAAALWLYAYAGGTPYQEAKALVIVAPLMALISVRAVLAAAPIAVVVAFLLAAGGSSALALVNGPVGPSGYSPELAEVGEDLSGSVFVVAPTELLADQHGRDYLVWELRGNRVCVAEPGASEPPPGVGTLSVAIDDDGAVVPEGAYLIRGGGESEACPLIEDNARADPAADGD